MQLELELKECIRERGEGNKASFTEQTGKHVGVVFEDLLLQHGQFYPPNPRPKGIRIGVHKQCFHNAWRVAMRDKRFRYAEGYVVTMDLPFPFLHGFIVDDAGAYDVTLPKPAAVYFGVEFDPLALVVGNGSHAFSTTIDWLIDNAAALKRFEAARVTR